jgi:hypothetical protein
MAIVGTPLDGRHLRSDISTIGHTNAVYSAAGPHLNAPEQLAENFRKFNLAQMLRFRWLAPDRISEWASGFAKRLVEASV